MLFAGALQKYVMLVGRSTNAFAPSASPVEGREVDMKTSEARALAPGGAEGALITHDRRKSWGPRALHDGGRLPKHGGCRVSQDTRHEEGRTNGQDFGRLLHGRIPQKNALTIFGRKALQTIDVRAVAYRAPG